MGKQRFRFSDMLPNAWFYKLKDMGRTRTQLQNKKQPTTQQQQQQPHISLPTYSYNFTAEPTKSERFKVHYNSPVNPKASDTHFPDHPSRKTQSSKKISKRKTIYKPSPGCLPSSSSVQSPDNIVPSADSSSDIDFAESDSEDVKFVLAGDSCKGPGTVDIVIDLDIDDLFSTRKADNDNGGSDAISGLELPPIMTNPSNCRNAKITKTRTSSVKLVKEGTATAGPKMGKSPSHATGIRLKGNSPRIGSKKRQAHSRKSNSLHTRSKPQNKIISESLVMVKSSYDPQSDFRESMVEMIVENNLLGSKELEDLLACYLSLNSKEYHELIVKAFEQVWFGL